MLSAKSCTLARPAVARRAQRAGAVRPVAALSQSQVAKLAAGVATVALAASVVAPVSQPKCDDGFWGGMAAFVVRACRCRRASVRKGIGEELRRAG